MPVPLLGAVAVDPDDVVDKGYVDAAVAAAGGPVLVTQTTHGLAVGNVVRLSGANYVKAQADSAANAEVVGVVSVVADANNFTLVPMGPISTLSGLTAGTVYFLSAATAGLLTATEPSTVGQVSKPALIASTTTAGFVVNMRGVVIATAPPAAYGFDYFLRGEPF